MKKILYTTGLKIVVKGLIIWSMIFHKSIKEKVLEEGPITDKAWSRKKLKTIDRVDNLITWNVYKLLGEGYVSAYDKKILRMQLSLVNLYLGHAQEMLYVA
ncbi:hypothetical protein [Clostridium sp.]|uniref:hypothetical protein n=1 Tax=Clostridium sp. TaxID=1506 RepID=UPI0039914463